MQKRYALCFTLLLTVLITEAQEVQWANKLVGFSSEFQKDNVGQEGHASQVLGRPNTLPPYGDNSCAWSPYNSDSNVEEWIKVGFQSPQKAKQVVVIENFNQGAVTRVFGYDVSGKETLIFENNFTQTTDIGKMLSIPITDTALVISAVKIVMNPSKVKGYNQIDAIGITSAARPVFYDVRVSKDAPKEIVKENLGASINSKGQELAPIISPDGKTLFFTRGKYEGNVGQASTQDVWFSHFEDKAWSTAENMGAPINNSDNNAIVSISTDGRTLFLMNVYRPDGTMAFGLSKSIKTKSGWTRPSECKIDDIYNLDAKNNSEFAISPKGNVLIMAIKRRDTVGDRDLYVSFLKADGSWSKPLNMGVIINTAETESTPFIGTDNRTLYFTSYGHAGYGSGDIFVCRRLDDTWTNWTEPENLGSAINTPKWDGFLSIPASGEYAYVSSKQNAIGEEDIFRFKVYPAMRPDPVAILSGSVLDAETNKPVKSDIVTDLMKDNSNVSKIEYDPETGEYKMIVPVKEAYRLTAPKDGYFSTSEIVDLTKDKKFRDIRKNILLVPIKVGAKLALSNVMFEQSKSELLSQALPDLDQIAAMMLKYPKMEILLEGHTDNQGDFKLNIQLSEDRVCEVQQYLSTKNIEPIRVQTKGWGASKPRANNQTEESRKRNRRVEFTILKM
jgi:outer membrane protein OmpA-like peptidoglycan-associated protein